jgi:hypothetical protein
LISHIVGEKGRSSEDLDPAIATVLRADDLFGSRPGFALSVGNAWHRMTRMLTLETWRPRPPSEALFDSFVGMARHIQKPKLTVALPHLDLHHPTRPTPTRALRFFEDERIWAPLSSRLAGSSKPAPEQQQQHQTHAHRPRLARRVVSMGLDLASHMSNAGKTDDALWVLELLRSNFGGEFDSGLAGLESRHYTLDGHQMPST